MIGLLPKRRMEGKCLCLPLPVCHASSPLCMDYSPGEEEGEAGLGGGQAGNSRLLWPSAAKGRLSEKNSSVAGARFQFIQFPFLRHENSDICAL